MAQAVITNTARGSTICGTVRRIVIVAAPALLAACHGHGGGADTVPAHPEALAAMGDGQAVQMLGTEPFWNAQVHHGMLTYTTPETTAAAPVPVSRFVGMGGVGFSGMLHGKAVQIAVSQASCSDGMSVRSYPLTVTLRIGEESRSGCGWTGDGARGAPTSAAPA